MDEAEIARLCESLSLAKEDGAIHQLEEDFQQEGLSDVSHYLVGKILSGKKVNRDAFIGLIDQLWSSISRVKIKLVGDNTFMFYFKHLEERNWIWKKRTLAF
ncbi:hypothetical protein Dsin_014117 [Dipteronia sinensis]|uniref:DUF4283 domain-containing protein n=1 Tax=Dipteronia sinensis TaxID=43782 RepID=A0AAE0EA11_9ROSI|nr:hypothetical protein Dsin_014117 [Dipteronia sinensis]